MYHLFFEKNIVINSIIREIWQIFTPRQGENSKPYAKQPTTEHK